MATSGGAGPQEAALKIVGEADDEAARTYIFRGEDHTLGNALRHVLMRQKDVEFCGYSVPHPSEPYVHLRVQTDGEKTASAMLKQGLKELGAACDTIEGAFDKACEKFESENMDDR